MRCVSVCGVVGGGAIEELSKLSELRLDSRYVKDKSASREMKRNLSNCELD